MKDGKRIDLPDTYHMFVSQNNTETILMVTTRKSDFLNGEANYSCVIVYADGSTEESEVTKVEIIDNCLCSSRFFVLQCWYNIIMIMSSIVYIYTY